MFSGFSGWLPLTQSVRHGSKAVTRHRKPMHILRQKLMAVTEYIPPKRVAPRGAYPAQTKKVQQVSGMEGMTQSGEKRCNSSPICSVPDFLIRDFKKSYMTSKSQCLNFMRLFSNS